jgi:hypothetical protein
LKEEHPQTLGALLGHYNSHIFKSVSSGPPYFVIINGVFVQDTPSIDCTAFEATSVALLVVTMTSTFSLCYIRVCAVWRWNRFIIGFFGVSWLSVAGSSVTMINSVKTLQVETLCTVIIADGRLVLVPFIVAVVNHTLVFMAITYGICKNTLSGDLTFRNGIMIMLGKSLPTFSKALLHDSQISYVYVLLPSPTRWKVLVNHIHLESFWGFLYSD